MLNKLLVYVVGLCFVLLCVSGLVIKYEHHELSKAKQANTNLQIKYDGLNKQYKMYQAFQGLNSVMSSQYEQKTTESAAKKSDILSTVDKTTKQVNSHEITSIDADTSYTHSMWDAYCQALPEDANCSTK